MSIMEAGRMVQIPEGREAEDRRGPGAARGTPSRRPYAPPVIESGQAFERVQLASGCNEGVEDCEVPC